MRGHRFVGALCVAGVLFSGCGDDDGAGGADPNTAAVNSLLNSLHFAGGVERLGRIPPTTDSKVRLDDAQSSALLEPGAAGLLPFLEDNPNAPEDPSAAVLMQFGDEPRHIEVPTSESVAGKGDINLAFDLDTGVCDELCNRRYTIAMQAAIKLDSDGIGALHDTEVVLDCRARGHKERCAAGEHSEAPDAPSAVDMDSGAGPQPDAADVPDGGAPQDSDASMPTSSLIDARGGRVSLPDGAEAVIPAMALSKPTAITLKLAANTPPLPSEVEGAGEPYAFEPHGATFDAPVTIRLPFTGSATGASVLRLDDDEDTTWEQADGTPTFKGGVAELVVTHFSIYQVVRPAPVTATDPCAQANGGCDTLATCVPAGQSRTCTCPSGYMGDGVGDGGCSDVLECATNNGGCGASYACIEQVGADPVCDLDECTTNNGGCGDATYTLCENQLGGASPICTDIDECATNNGGCGDPTYVACADNVGAAPTCTDIPQCATNNGGCGDVEFVTCVENPGAAATCADILECAVSNGGCGSPGYVLLGLIRPAAGRAKWGGWPAERVVGVIAEGGAGPVLADTHRLLGVSPAEVVEVPHQPVDIAVVPQVVAVQCPDVRDAADLDLAFALAAQAEVGQRRHAARVLGLRHLLKTSQHRRDVVRSPAAALGHRVLVADRPHADRRVVVLLADQLA